MNLLLGNLANSQTARALRRTLLAVVHDHPYYFAELLPPGMPLHTWLSHMANDATWGDDIVIAAFAMWAEQDVYVFTMTGVNADSFHAQFYPGQPNIALGIFAQEAPPTAQPGALALAWNGDLQQGHFQAFVPVDPPLAPITLADSPEPDGYVLGSDIFTSQDSIESSWTDAPSSQPRPTLPAMITSSPMDVQRELFAMPLEDEATPAGNLYKDDPNTEASQSRSTSSGRRSESSAFRDATKQIMRGRRVVKRPNHANMLLYE